MQEIITRPDIDFFLFKNDATLLRLACPITEFTDAVQPVCLPSLRFRDVRGDDALISGWGSTEAGTPQA